MKRRDARVSGADAPGAEQADCSSAPSSSDDPPIGTAARGSRLALVLTARLWFGWVVFLAVMWWITPRFPARP